MTLDFPNVFQNSSEIDAAIDLVLKKLSDRVSELENQLSADGRVYVNAKQGKVYLERRRYDPKQKRTRYVGSVKGRSPEHNEALAEIKKLEAAKRSLVAWRDKFAGVLKQ